MACLRDPDGAACSQQSQPAHTGQAFVSIPLEALLGAAVLLMLFRASALTRHSCAAADALRVWPWACWP